MKIHRRRVSGRPLLVASAGAALTLVACGEKEETGSFTSGNLVAPPEVELCVTVEPAEAVVTVDGAPLAKGGCQSVYEGTHALHAEATGYRPFDQSVDVTKDMTFPIAMEPK
jgi:hypothetical protein